MKNEEEERKQAAEEAARKEDEVRKRNEEAEIKKRQEESEGLRLTKSQKDQQTAEQVDTQGGQDHTDQGHGQSNPDLPEPVASSGSTLGQASFSRINLIPFMPIEGEEILDFSAIFYDKDKKRIVKIIEKKDETGGHSGKMITDKTLVHGMDIDPILIVRARVELTQ